MSPLYIDFLTVFCSAVYDVFLLVVRLHGVNQRVQGKQSMTSKDEASLAPLYMVEITADNRILSFLVPTRHLIGGTKWGPTESFTEAEAGEAAGGSIGV